MVLDPSTEEFIWKSIATNESCLFSQDSQFSSKLLSSKESDLSGKLIHADLREGWFLLKIIYPSTHTHTHPQILTLFLLFHTAPIFFKLLSMFLATFSPLQLYPSFPQTPCCPTWLNRIHSDSIQQLHNNYIYFIIGILTYFNSGKPQLKAALWRWIHEW